MHELPFCVEPAGFFHYFFPRSIFLLLLFLLLLFCLTLYLAILRSLSFYQTAMEVLHHPDSYLPTSSNYSYHHHNTNADPIPIHQSNNDIRSSSSPSHTDTFKLADDAHQRPLSRCNSTSLADLIPAATAAMRASSEYKRRQEPDPEASLNTAFARALAKVKVQVQTKRLKEKYLAHEWIRLALGLPVDESKINQNPNGFITADDVQSTLSTPRIAYKNLDGRTGEIATWYEWKINKSRFTVDEVERKVDRLRQKKFAHHQASLKS
ncbi:uncharacterized protein BYT42DRAFT_576112 [Radiomyces spectabilis]|uniref:uncharacterized protein n=1 Tax=Radiomyces spectabilis TaxID=64574 RepID=UPI00221F8B10|nr:uncharacterized protein BYT42DRAFT_576112 [Radiomyces spectabilis]KAI8374366.1 hypothetical protein BYT42DRAFT_576112 [Radiomyces spectabilis]